MVNMVKYLFFQAVGKYFASLRGIKNDQITLTNLNKMYTYIKNKKNTNIFNIYTFY